MSPDGPSSHLDLEVLAAALRGHSDDLSLYAGFLLNVLSSALPRELIEVEREGKWKARLAGRDPAVLSVAVRLGDHRYELTRTELGKPAAAKIRHESGGVVMSTRTVGIDEWSRGLATDLAGRGPLERRGRRGPATADRAVRRPEPDGTRDMSPDMTPEQLARASAAEIAAGRLPLTAQRRSPNAAAAAAGRGAFTSGAVRRRVRRAAVGRLPPGRSGDGQRRLQHRLVVHRLRVHGRRLPDRVRAVAGGRRAVDPAPDRTGPAPGAAPAAPGVRRPRRRRRGRGRADLGSFYGNGLEFMAIGTAVRAYGDVRPPQPFTSDLSGQEFAQAGRRRLAARPPWCMGIGVALRHDDWRTAAPADSSWTNQELGGATELVSTPRGRRPARGRAGRAPGTAARASCCGTHAERLRGSCTLRRRGPHDHFAERVHVRYRDRRAPARGTPNRPAHAAAADAAAGRGETR